MNVKTTIPDTWTAPTPIDSQRVLHGAPEASSLVLHKDERSELGLWRVTPGDITTLHQGYVEFITIIEGRGELVEDDGTVTELRPGTVFVMKDGWSGRWVIHTELIKSYAIIPAVPPTNSDG